MSINIKDINKKFGDFVALEDINVDLPTGQLTALLGPSGGGKSTLLRIIAGLDKADEGTVSIEGVNATKLPPQKRNVGFVFQHYAAFKHMTVRDNVAFGLTVRKKPKAEIESRVSELLKIVGLAGYSKRYPSQLSGGQRQRMALARALAVEPRVLLLDEPFGALDAKVRADLREWLRKLHDEVNVTTLLVTHDQEEAMSIADQIAVMDHSRIEQVGTPRELYDRPETPFVMRFLGPVTRLGEALVRPHDIALSLDQRPGSFEAQVARVVHLGFEVRAELVLGDGEEIAVQLTRSEADELELAAGDIVHVRSTAMPQREPDALSA